MSDTTKPFNISSLSPIFQYKPYGNGPPENGWAGFLSDLNEGDTSTGHPYRYTSAASATFELGFLGTGIQLYGSIQQQNGGSCSYNAAIDGSDTKSGSSSPADSSAPLVSWSNLSLGKHTLTTEAKCTNGGTFQFNYAIVQAWVGPAGGQLSTKVVDDTDPEINYTVQWQSNTHISARYQNDTQHFTNVFGDSFTYKFTGTAITVYGSIDHLHGQYEATLDGVSTQFNGSAPSLAVPVQIFFQAGLDAKQQHELKITNLGRDPAPYLDLDYIEVTQSTVPGGASSSPPGSGSGSGSSTNVSAIAGGVAGGVGLILLLIAAYFLFWRRRARRLKSSKTVDGRAFDLGDTGDYGAIPGRRSNPEDVPAELVPTPYIVEPPNTEDSTTNRGSIEPGSSSGYTRMTKFQEAMGHNRHPSFGSATASGSGYDPRLSYLQPTVVSEAVDAGPVLLDDRIGAHTPSTGERSHAPQPQLRVVNEEPPPNYEPPAPAPAPALAHAPAAGS